jgi:sugar O-acyltransferase (sialic acid O-acetyltransferase NeuD family)
MIMMGNVFGLFGTGGCARGIMPFAREIALGKERCGSVVFVETQPKQKEVNGIPVLSEEEFLALPADKKLFNVGIANSKVREKIVERCAGKGCLPLALRAPDVIEYEGNEFGEGGILCARTMITVNAKIGKYFHANIYSYVEHDCVIGDFVTFAPRVNCNGNIRIGNHVYIGTGAMIKQGSPGKPLVIGDGAVIGMGAVVTKDVPAGATVIGNPAHIVK